MSNSTADLVARAKKFREVSVIQHESVPNVAETLEKISKFLQEHESPTVNDCTHTVFDNYNDWWMGPKPNHKFAIAEDNTIDCLYRHISTLYDLGIPLTLSEKCTAEIRFVQDIDIWGDANNVAIQGEELVNCESPFMRLLGKVMAEIYPEQSFLDVVIFESTGLSKMKGVMKTSVRLVWSNIVVDKERAGRIRDYIVHQIKNNGGDKIKELEQRFLACSRENQWINVMGDAIYFGRFGIRMPLCDRVSPAPLKKPEQRPFRPLGVVRFNYAENDIEKIETLCDKDALLGCEWLKIGCIRKEAGSPLTPWVKPTLSGGKVVAQASNRSSVEGTSNTGNRISMRPQPVSRFPGQVRIRTNTGSDRGGGVRAKPRGLQQSEERSKEMTVEREFSGTVAEFKEKLNENLGSQPDDSYMITPTSLVWTQPNGGGARIEFKSSNRRVYFIGKLHQIRVLMASVTSVVQPVGEADRAFSTRSSHMMSHMSERASLAPSAVYTPSATCAPSAVYAPSAAFSRNSTSANHGGTRSNTQTESKRVASRRFDAEGVGEITLAQGDLVTITHDPEEGQHNIHRWVYGTNESAQTRGWFPLSHTSPIEEITPQGTGEY